MLNSAGENRCKTKIGQICMLPSFYCVFAITTCSVCGSLCSVLIGGLAGDCCNSWCKKLNTLAAIIAGVLASPIFYTQEYIGSTFDP